MKAALHLTLVALATAVAVSGAWPQQASIDPSPGFTLDAATKSATVDLLVKELNDRYILPDIAAKIEKSLAAWRSTSEYSDVTDPKEFATKVNELLKKEVTDAHLRFRYSEKPLPVRAKAGEPSADELKRYEEQTKFVNAGFEKVERLRGNVGYIAFNGFWEPKDMKRPLQGAMTFLANVDAFIIDLRHNGGGDPEGVKLFCSYFFGPKPVHINDIVYREGKKVTTTEYWTLKSVDGPRFPDVPVYVLVSKRTGSGAEECAYDLQQTNRGLVLGEPTWGGANPGDNVRLGDHFSCFIPVGMARNPYTKTNWEGAGVQPDVKVDPETSLKDAHVMAVKKLIETCKDDGRRADLEGVLKAIVNGA